MFKKMPVILLCMIVLASLTHSILPLPLKSALYALSLSLKSCIVFVLPFLIFGLLFKTSAQLSKTASKILLFVILGICISNLLSTMMSYSFGSFAYSLDLSMSFPEAQHALIPTWELHLPKFVENHTAMLSGLFLGFVLGRFKPILATRLSTISDTLVNGILQGFLYVIPFFILGFIVKMAHDEIIYHILGNYIMVFGVVVSGVFSYIALIYLAVNRFQVSAAIQNVKNLLPAAIAGFGSMSSAAVMPLTILGSEKNCKNPDIARSVIPMSVNIHLMGDCFAIPIFAFALLKNFAMPEPTFWVYLIFALYFVLAKFSVAGVPGGGVLVMLPIIESNLGFTSEMLSLITALYILFDPVITCANILGNGGFTLVMDRLLAKKESLQQEFTQPK